MVHTLIARMIGLEALRDREGSGWVGGGEIEMERKGVMAGKSWGGSGKGGAIINSCSY